jgi:uncharacterized protein YdhG (YjbR/CyaY superfamily)
MVKPTTVEEYIAALEEPAASRMRELRTLAREAAPEAGEALKWGSPALLHPSGMILLICSAHRRHANFTVTPSTREAFTEDLTGFETGKGSVKLPYDVPVPAALLRRMIAYRLREYEEDGVTWM